MKNRCKFLFILIYAVAILFYRADSVVAMAAEENIEPEQTGESIAGTEAESVEESGAEAEIERIQESIEGSVAETEAKQEAIEEPADETETEQEGIEEPVAGLEPELIEEPIVDTEAEQIMVFATASEAEQTISTGSALTEWLEAHKNTGGRVKLSDHVVLDGEYSFCPSGINMPSVFVDTDKYTITVNGEVELLSDDHLIFSGQPDGKGIFYVAEKGMLSMQGITVESESCALWQEEGGGLAVSECHISGSIHYADTPFVIYQNSVCVVVEKSQTLNDVLPAQISCAVNRQGKVSYNERVPLSWDLEGTERQQEERQRFMLQGSFLGAASAEPVECTVVYNDYPLTFTDVKASLSAGQYTFQGGYTKPEEALPITVMSEYSFDGENWLTYEETKVTDIYTGFFIAFRSEQFDRAAYSNIYIRLRWNDNGSEYFSNVLCYAADNLETAEDIGGSRGGGTSIINLPDDPQKNDGDAPAKDENRIPKESHNTSDNVKAEALPGTEQTEQRDRGSEPGVASGGQFSEAENMNAGTSNADTEQPLYTELPGTHAEQPLYTEVPDTNENQPLNGNPKDINEEQAFYAEPEAGGQENINYSTASSQMNAQTLHADIRRNNYTVIVTGFVLLSVIAGIAGFYVHSRLGTNR